MMSKNARMAIYSKWLMRLIPIGLVLLASSCLESKPKILGGKKLDITAVDTANAATFRFNFAYRDPAVLAAVPIYLQAVANSSTVMSTTCNLAGTGCQCEFLDSATPPNVLSSATSAYDSVGNFFTCTYGGVLASLASVRLRNIAGTKVSDAVPVVTTITATTLVGSDLDVNKVRTVYKYLCAFNYLEKHGSSTAPGSFLCTNTLSFCGAGRDYCFLELNYPFYLYSDNYSTNMYKQMSDLVYNAGGSNVLCGKQAKQYDCSATAVGVAAPNLAKSFGLYSQQAGNFQVPVNLIAAPSQSTEVYGYAANVGTSGNCPPGMVKRDFYTTTVPAQAESTMGADSFREIGALAPAAAPSAVINRQIGNGV
ncbi:MAG: hypothetical protein ACXVBE_14550, partial [Bdellovibrionota bacterium]